MDWKCLIISRKFKKWIYKLFILTFLDNVPLSYKEDLLGEIALMKKLGRHRNIVSLVGACTLNEPIALIMEFVPFGNLQAFLK